MRERRKSGKPDWLIHGGEMGDLIRRMDWSATALGPRDSWPPALRASLNTILSSAFPMAILWGKDLLLLYNDAYRVIAAGKHPAAMGQSTRDCWPEVWQINQPMLATVMFRGEGTYLENRLFRVTRSGYLEETYFTLSYSPIWNEDGTVGGTLVTLLETTAAVLSERRMSALRDLAAQTSTVSDPNAACEAAMKVLEDNQADVSFALIYLMNPEATELSLAGLYGVEPGSPAAAPRLVLTRRQDKGQWPVNKALSAGTLDVEGLVERFGLVFRQSAAGSPRSAVLFALRHAGDKPDVGVLILGASSARPLDEDYRTFLKLVADQVASAVGHAIDHMQERSQARAELNESEERFRVAQELSPDGFTILRPVRDAESQIVDFTWLFENQAISRINGTDPGAVIGRRLLELFPGHKGSAFFEAYKAVADTGERRVLEARYQGESIRSPIWLRVVVVRTGQDIAVLAQDITERKRTEEILEQRVAERTAEAEKRAEELRALAAELARTEQRERKRLAQWLHDDLQQVLVATKMQISLTQAGISEPGLRELLQKASQLIDESIGQSRALTAELSPPALYQSGLIAGLEQLAQWMEEKHNLHVTVETTADVDAENQEAAIILFSAARELLFNVVKHAGVSEARVTVTEKQGRVELTVEDGGAGFDPAALGAGKGGFGLLNVRERLHVIDGELKVRSEPGRGTSVTLVVPASLPAKVRRETELAPIDATDLAAAFSNDKEEETIKVLLVDDHQVLRQGLASLLANEAGIEVVGQAADGYEAVELARQLRPEVITMDISMPRMNGIEATRLIKSELPEIRVVGLSMHDEKGQARALYEAGVDAYVNKGGPSDELVRTIRRIVRRNTGVT